MAAHFSPVLRFARAESMIPGVYGTACLYGVSAFATPSRSSAVTIDEQPFERGVRLDRILQTRDLHRRIPRRGLLTHEDMVAFSGGFPRAARKGRGAGSFRHNGTVWNVRFCNAASHRWLPFQPEG
jgi:hypothetical protein